eukprot:2569310-Pleurochrysis_carterae.AAC.1
MHTFKRGYAEYAFRRVCVRAEMIHGEANARYVQRKNERLKITGKDKAGFHSAATSPQFSVVQAMTAETALNEVAAMAVWPC